MLIACSAEIVHPTLPLDSLAMVLFRIQRLIDHFHYPFVGFQASGVASCNLDISLHPGINAFYRISIQYSLFLSLSTQLKFRQEKRWEFRGDVPG